MRAGFACSVTGTYRRVFEKRRDVLKAREQLFKSLKLPPKKVLDRTRRNHGERQKPKLKVVYGLDL